MKETKKQTISNNNNKCALYKNCKYCEHSNTCKRFKCQYICPTPDNENESSMLLRQLLSNIKPTNDRYLRVESQSQQTMNSDGTSDNTDISDINIDDTVDLCKYYTKMINDCLKTIRGGGTAYLYKLSQVKEVLRFQQDVSLSVCDGVYYISMNNR